ncbi:MAG: hypothetical protein HOP11_15595 [Saprospiraceae bacterium]|nr:hypothetical protein [Saprospiraceae bacterium]
MLELIAILWAIAATLQLIYIILLTFDAIVQFFHERVYLKNRSKSNIAFSLQEKLNSGKYNTVYGIFDKSSNEILDAKNVQSNQVDSQIANNHAYEELCVYN